MADVWRSTLLYFVHGQGLPAAYWELLSKERLSLSSEVQALGPIFKIIPMPCECECSITCISGRGEGVLDLLGGEYTGNIWTTGATPLLGYGFCAWTLT